MGKYQTYVYHMAYFPRLWGSKHHPVSGGMSGLDLIKLATLSQVPDINNRVVALSDPINSPLLSQVPDINNHSSA